MRIYRDKKKNIIFTMLTLLIFQNPLEQIIPHFSMFEECLALIGFFTGGLYILREKRIHKYILISLFVFSVFILGTLCANIIFRYQSIKSVFIDCFTNLKFLGLFFLGILIAMQLGVHRFINIAAKCAKLSSVIFLFSTIIDIVYTNLLTDGIKYNIYGLVMKYMNPSVQYLYQAKKLKLFFMHSTYLGGALVFLLIIFALDGCKRHTFDIGICIILLIMTGRSKAIAAAGIYILLLFIYEKRRKILSIKGLLLIGILALAVGWTKIDYFYGELSGTSARSILTLTSLQIARDYFPFGTGFATFASDQAVKNYSYVYTLYGLDQFVETAPDSKFLNDVMWPIILGQGGILGLLCYIIILSMLLMMCMKIQKENRDQAGMWAPLFGFFYLMISSLGEPTFVNLVSMPIALLMGVMCYWKIIKNDKECEAFKANNCFVTRRSINEQ